MIRIDVGDIVALASVLVLIVIFLIMVAIEHVKQKIRSIKRKLKKRKCKHDWVLADFQKLTDDNLWTYKCVDCGKYEQRG